MDSGPAATLVEERLEERAVHIFTKILERSLLLVYEEEREDRRHINALSADKLSNAPISWLYVLQLRQLIPKRTRRDAVRSLYSTVSSLIGSIDGQRRNRPSSSTTAEDPFIQECRGFGQDFRPTLLDVRHKIDRGASELELLKSVMNLFELIFTLYYKEKGCEPSLQKPLQYLQQIRPPPCLGELVAVDTASAVHQVEAARTSTVMQPHSEVNAQYGRTQTVTVYNGLITIFTSHIVPMTPVVARRNSVFVSGTNPGDLHITQGAYAYATEDGRCVIPGSFCLNETYTPENANQTPATPNSVDTQRFLTYVGCQYPDGTSLSYIPISRARLVYERNLNHRQPIMRTGNVTFAFLHVFLPHPVYQGIKQRAKDIFCLHHPNTQFVDHHETPSADGKMVKIEVLVKSERTVRIMDRNRQLDYPVLQALFGCRHDICGPCLMHMRFTSTKRGMQRLQLRLILFGITVTRTRHNYNDAIFDLLDSPPGPIQTPPVPASYLM